MQYFNLKEPTQIVSFAEAIQLGLGNQQGLFMPSEIPEFFDRRIAELLNMPFAERSVEILAPFLAPDIDYDEVKDIVHSAFDFPAKLVSINETKNQHVLELFHGPSLAFKDFGARFLARCLSNILGSKETTILTATSGDTWAAVAHAFYAVDNVRVVILYPKGKVAPLQEKLFSTLGYNIETLAVDGDFDACQALVKQAFSDDKLREEVPISSANSINIARLLAQVCYYFEIMAQHPQVDKVSVPSGNFGNLTAGLIAKAMGLPIQQFMAATNANDTVPRFLQDGTWAPKHPIITRELLDTLPDDELERAIIDNMHLKMEQDLSDEIIILQKSTIGRQTIYTTWWIEGEVRNGGFNQYFFNSNGIYLPYLLNGLKELNDSDYSSIVNKAIQIYEQEVKEQHDSQDGSMEEFMDSYESNPLDALDEEFYKLIKNKPLADLRVNYIRNHYAQFIEK